MQLVLVLLFMHQLLPINLFVRNENTTFDIITCTSVLGFCIFGKKLFEKIGLQPGLVLVWAVI